MWCCFLLDRVTRPAEFLEKENGNVFYRETRTAKFLEKENGNVFYREARPAEFLEKENGNVFYRETRTAKFYEMCELRYNRSFGCSMWDLAIAIVIAIASSSKPARALKFSQFCPGLPHM